MFPMRNVLLLLPSLLAAPLQSPDGVQNNDIVPLVPQERAVIHMDFFENGTVKHQTPEESPYFEIIPLGALCDFCFAVVEMLKNVQKSDANFEETIRKDCLEHTTDSSKKEICGYVDKINLERLKKDAPSKLCMEERLCFEQRPEQKEKTVGQLQDEKPKEQKKEDKPTAKELSNDPKVQRVSKRHPWFINRTVSLRMFVEDIAK